ncbi:uncharacterized protein LOC127289038 [Leptopilina boulardi]|uniref:uncharacterized protein LOC127289038 n=1 Tax=Leptopilina boulardi TaxID=63433 RepID=UPI0021F55683|nr:uncharacterized protein LOC127289038 [Leptopilina boulardi]
MNNTEYFIIPLRNVDLVSIFNSISILSQIFYDDNLLTENNPYRPIPIVNKLCEYLQENNNDNNASISIVKKILKNTHFYGGKENEIIDIKYANAEINNIIASIVFSKFGNTFGYLATIVKSTNNLTLPFLKMKIKKDLLAQKYLDQNLKFSQLTEISVKQIVENLIFPLFPEPPEENELRIIDIDYIYAQAGLMFTRNSHIYSANTTFEEFITISQSVEQGVHHGLLNIKVLQIFQLPALLYYAYKNRQNDSFHLLVKDKDFWNDAFFVLFSHLNEKQEIILNLQKNNSVYLFEKELFAYKNRTEYAEFVLKIMCPMADDSEYKEEINNYKNDPDNYHCKRRNNFLLPDINELFSSQNKHIAKLYSNVEKQFIADAFSEEIIKFIEQKNVTVSIIEAIPKNRCNFRCQALIPQFTLKNDTILFQTNVNGVDTVLYALIKNNTMILINNKNNSNLFLNTLGLSENTKFNVPYAKEFLKKDNQTFDTFLTNLIKPKRLEFYKRLQDHGYESTGRESVLEFLKNFLPFYTCVQAVKTETAVIAVCACIVDSIVLIPLVGQATNTGLKFFNAALKPLLLYKTGLKAFTIGQFIGTTLKNFAIQTSEEFLKLVTKELFLDIGAAILRTLDPGIEFLYTLGKAGLKAIVNCFKLIERKVMSLTNVLTSLKKVSQPSVIKVNTFEHHDVFVSSINGQDGYGVKYLKIKEQTVELRRVQGYENEVPVVLVSKSDKKIYQIIDVESETLTPTRWQLNADDILHVEIKPLRVRLKTIVAEGLGGRGSLNNLRQTLKRETDLMKANVIREWRDKIEESFLSDTLRQYVLEDSDLRTSALEYILIHNKLPDWMEYYKLTNINDFQVLRYNTFLESGHLTEAEAVDRSNQLFKNKYKSNTIGINVRENFQIYKINHLHCYVNFDDFCSITHFLNNGPEKFCLQNPEGWHIQNAFNKVAMRFIDIPAYDVPRSFFKLEKVPAHVFLTIKSGQFKQFQNYINLDLNPLAIVENLKTIIPDGVSVHILYEIIVDNPYLIIDLEKLIPQSSTAVLIPNFEFLISDVDFYHYIDGNLVYKVILKNTSINKSKWIATLNQNIEKLNKEIQVYDNVLNDFDVDLLN